VHTLAIMIRLMPFYGHWITFVVIEMQNTMPKQGCRG
jgi:hypothetical protein